MHLASDAIFWSWPEHLLFNIAKRIVPGMNSGHASCLTLLFRIYYPVDVVHFYNSYSYTPVMLNSWTLKPLQH